MTGKSHNASMKRHLPSSLQSRGVTLHPSYDRREGGAGPAQGITLVVNNRPVTVPTTGKAIPRSPFSLQHRDGKHLIYNNGSPLLEVYLPHSPRYYSLTTASGVEYRKIALLHGADCLASTVLQHCTHWDSAERCSFCGIEISLRSGATLAQKTPQELLEVAKAAHLLDGISHVTLTAGAQPDESFEVAYLASCSALIKAETNLPVHVQCMPPRNLDTLTFLKESGVDTIGVHRESFDQTVLRKRAPCKAAIPLQRYIAVWEESVKVFGVNQVSSFIIAGLGEDNQSTIDGAALLCDLGVYPFILPLRPIPGTPLAGVAPPDTDQTIPLYQEVASLLQSRGLSWRRSKAGCVRCGACSGLPDFEESPPPDTLDPAPSQGRKEG